MEAAPALAGAVDQLRLDATAPEPTGPQVRRRRGDWDDDDTDVEDAPPRQVPRVRGWPEVVAEMDPLPENTAKARFVAEFPDPREYPAWVSKELVSENLVPTTYEAAWAKLCTAKDRRDALTTRLEKAEAKLASAEAALRRNASAANQGKRDRAAEAVARARVEAATANEHVDHLEDEVVDGQTAEGGEALAYHKHPYELLAKKVRLRREAEADYEVLPEQLPPLSDPRNLGVAVYKIFEDDDERKQWVESMKHAVDNTPEFAEQHHREGGAREGQRRSIFDMTQTNIAAGGFAALNHPSSFHNQFVRSLRMFAHGEVVFRDLFGMTDNGANSGSTHLEQVVDRMMVRRSSQTPTSEAWHRDVAVGTRPGDRVFGGWINLNSYDQKFSCVLGSAQEARDPNDPVGFAKVFEKDHPEIVARSSKVVIPPGHMIVFNEDTIHEVVNNQNTATLLRLFTGWRLSRWEPFGPTPEPLIVDLDRRLSDQEGMPLKSGQHKHYDSDEYFEDKVPEARKYNATTNPTGFGYYPGPPPFYPSAYWGQIDPATVIQFCQLLKPELVHTRFFNPSTSQKRSAQFPNGVKCNLDIHHAPSGTQFNANDAQPHKADTIRGLKELKEWMESHHRNREVAQWMQEDYAPEEVAILKPRAIQALRLMLTSPACVARASPRNRATAVNLRPVVEPIARLLQVPPAPPQ